MITCELVSYAGRAPAHPVCVQQRFRIPLRRIGLHGAPAVSRREGRCRDSYEFLLQGHDYDSVHPSLQRRDVLNLAYGLYEVLSDRIYQVRGFDVANITFVKGTPAGSCSIR